MTRLPLNAVRASTQNTFNVLRLFVENLADDPHNFGLQITRKFATTRQIRMLEGVSAVFPSNSRFEVLAALLAEDRQGVERAIEAQSDAWNNPQIASRLANVAIASGLWDLAGRILDSETNSPKAVRTRARLEFSLGNIERSISILDSAGLGLTRQARHYRSELSVLTVWEPVVEKQVRNWSLSGTPNVLYVATNSLPFTASGYTQRTHSLLLSLLESGTTVSGVTRVGYPLSIGNVLAPAESRIDSVSYRRILPARQHFDAAGKIQQQANALCELVKKTKPTVLHTTTDFTNALSVRTVARAFNIPWVYEVRGQLADTWASKRPLSSQESIKYTNFRSREFELASDADAVLTLGNEMRSNLVAGGVDTERITIIPNAVGNEYSAQPQASESVRSQLGLREDAEYFGTVSSLVEYEGLELLIDVLAKLSESRPKLRLLVVGDGVQREPLIRRAKELDVAHLCDFVGRVPRNKAILYHQALDVFAVPRKNLSVTRDVTPLKPVEAMASGTPVIASDLPALAELIDDGVTGYLADPSSVNQWCELLDKLLVDPSVRREIGESARQSVLKNRTWSSCSSKLNRIYRSLATGR